MNVWVLPLVSAEGASPVLPRCKVTCGLRRSRKCVRHVKLVCPDPMVRGVEMRPVTECTARERLPPLSLYRGDVRVPSCDIWWSMGGVGRMNCELRNAASLWAFQHPGREWESGEGGAARPTAGRRGPRGRLPGR